MSHKALIGWSVALMLVLALIGTRIAYNREHAARVELQNMLDEVVAAHRKVVAERRIEALEEKATEAVANERKRRDYEDRISGVRKHFAVLVRRAAKADSVPSRSERLPVSKSACGPDEAARKAEILTLDEKRICTDTAERLVALQGWIAQQAEAAP